jgi:large subunit ribosomal protein L17
MRHGDKVNNLGRKAGHRHALLKNMSKALIQHKRINTTLAKAKALRTHIEPILTKSKDNTTHSRRIVFSYIQDKAVVKELFDVVAPKIANRPGGYVRVIKTGFRLGDGAQTAMIELVDFNENLLAIKEAKPARKKTRRSRGVTASKPAVAATTETVTTTEVITETVKGTDPEFDALMEKDAE